MAWNNSKKQKEEEMTTPDFKGFAKILEQFDPEYRMAVLDKLLIFSLELSGKASTSSNMKALTSVLEKKPQAQDSSLYRAAKKNASMFAYGAGAKDTETKDLLKALSMTQHMSSIDKQTKKAAEDSRSLIFASPTDSLEALAKYGSQELYKEKYKEILAFIIEQVGTVRCIELDLEHNGIIADVWERHSLKPLIDTHGVKIYNLEAAKEAFRIQWALTYESLKDAYENSSYSVWHNNLCQLDVRTFEVLLFDTSMKERLYYDEEFMGLYKSRYTYTNKPIAEEVEYTGAVLLSPEEEQERIDTEVEEIFQREYRPKPRLFNYQTLDESKIRPIWDLSRTQPSRPFIDNYLDPLLEPCKDFRTAVLNVLTREFENK